MVKHLQMKMLFLLGLLFAGAGSAWAETVTLQYSGSTTTNMTGNNDAATLGLSATEWSVVGAKGGNSNFPGLNKSGYIALYYNATASNTLTITTLKESTTINSIKINYTSSDYNKGKVLVGNTEVSLTNDIYAINNPSCVITNGNTSNIQVRIASIEIVYSSNSAPTTAYTVTLGDDNTQLTETSPGAGVILPTRDAVGSYTFAGWSVSSLGNEEVTEAPTIIPAGEYNPLQNVTLYPVYTRSEENGVTEDVLVHQMKYKDKNWNLGPSYTDKNTYTLLAKDEYVESGVFDLSIISRIDVYGGTFGGADNNSLTIGDGTNTWMDVEVSGTSATKKHSFTNDNNPLSGTGKLRVTSNSGKGTSTGVRLSQVDIYKSQAVVVSYYTQIPSTVQKPAAPVFTIDGGAVVYNTTVELSTSTEDAKIYYTTDNSEPTANSIEYSSAIAIIESVTIKAVAIKEGVSSAVVSASFSIKAPNAPTFSPAAGEIVMGEAVTITQADAFKIIYTTDGTAPVYSPLNGSEYTTPIVINESLTIKAIAIDEGGNASSVATAAYTVVVPAQTEITLGTEPLTFSPGSYNSSGSGYQSYTNVTYKGSDNVNYSGWNLTDVMKSGTSMQLSKNTGKVVLPKINSGAGFTISVTATTNSVNVSDGTKTGTNELNVESTEANITISAGSSYAVISTITITPREVKAVATPVISLAEGTYTESQNVTITCETEGATIHYTLDGNDPTTESLAYSNPITISQSCTLKAIAVKDNDLSYIASASYTFPTVYTTITDFMTANTTGYLNLTGAQVVYIDSDKKNIYVRDNSGAIDLYNSNSFTTTLKTGDILSGTIYGKYSPYKNLPEITNITDISVLTSTSNEAVVAKVIDGTTSAIAANLCDLVKIESTEIALSNDKYYVGDDADIQLFDNFHVGYTVTTGKAVDVQGIAVVYNTTYELFPRVAEDIVYLDNAVAVSIGEAGLATFCSDKALDFSAVDAIEVYIATLDGQNITFTQIHKVPAETGVLLRNALGEGSAVAAINVPVLSGDADAVTDNALVGTLVEIPSLASQTENGYNYILNNGSKGIGFYKANNQKVAAGKAYLQAPLEVRSFIGFGDTGTWKRILLCGPTKADAVRR